MALVNGEQISAHSHEQLVEKVYNFIEENF